MKILLDMNLSPDWVDVFVESNISAVHWSTIGGTLTIIYSTFSTGVLEHPKKEMLNNTTAKLLL